MINDRDTGTDLFHLFHVVRGIDDGRSLTVEFQNPFQNLITALRIYSNGRFIHDDESGLMDNAACDIQSS